MKKILILLTLIYTGIINAIMIPVHVFDPVDNMSFEDLTFGIEIEPDITMGELLAILPTQIGDENVRALSFFVQTERLGGFPSRFACNINPNSARWNNNDSDVRVSDEIMAQYNQANPYDPILPISFDGPNAYIVLFIIRASPENEEFLAIFINNEANVEIIDNGQLDN
jgi:hypothetical protein